MDKAMSYFCVKSKSLLLVLALSFVSLSVSAKGVFYVKSGANGNGSSWSNAFGNVQQAVDSAAKRGADVWVAKGVYKNGSSPVVTLKPNVCLYGGFAGNETSLAARDTAANPTVLDGSEKNRVVFQESAFDSTSAVVVDGFTIQNGTAENGGGVNINANTTINNCIIKGNTSSGYGSAIYAKGARVTNTQIIGNKYLTSNHYAVYLNGSKMDGCLVKNNEGYFYAAIYAENGSEISDCVVEANKSYYNYRGSCFISSTVRNCKFINTNSDGGSVELQGNAVLSNCLFEGNKIPNNNLIADWSGDARVEDCQILNNESNYILLSTQGKYNRCVIKGNKLASRIFDLYRSTASVSNCLIYDNICSSNDEPVYLNGGASMINCTIVRNKTTNGKIVRVRNSVMKNSIVVGNKTDGIYGGVLTLDGTNTVSNNMLEATFVGGNMDGSMQYAAFTNAGNADFSLSANSYCINAGADVSDLLDVLGKTRKQGGAVDMGAIESAHTKAPSFTCGDIVYVKSGAKGNGSSWSSAFGDVQQAIFAAAADGKTHQIWVAAGTYYGDTTLSTVVSLASGISLYGGFAGTETSLSARDTARNPTILDGMGKRRVISQNFDFDKSKAVVVDGFTIQNGFATNGGGLGICGNTTINNCIVKDNKASNSASAINATGSTIKNSLIIGNSYRDKDRLNYTLQLVGCEMDNCEVKSNKTYSHCLVYAQKGSIVSNCVFEGNSAQESSSRGGVFDASSAIGCKFVNSNNGGASLELQGKAVVRDCLFEKNSLNGTLIYDWSGDARVEDCRILNNTTTSVLLSSRGKYNRCVIQGNTISSRIIDFSYSAATISNCLISDNISSSSDEPIYLYDGASMNNCTVARNSTNCTKIVYMNTSSMRNSIVVGNKKNSGYSGVFNLLGTNTISNNMLEGSFVEGNIDGSMQYAAFTDAENGDYSLSSNSYCINAGADLADSLDVFGKTRKQGGAVDMGAIESAHTKAPSFTCGDIVYVKSGAKGNGSSWSSAFGDVQQAIFAAAADGKKHQIWVAAGTYYGDTTLSTVVNLASGISLYGGFAGTETSLSARDTAKNPTILDGMEKRRVITQNYAFDKSKAVVVDGFTIRNGSAVNGGGLNINANTTINNCIVKENKVSGYGSAINATGATIKNTQIIGNSYAPYMHYTVYLTGGLMDSCAVKNNEGYNQCAIYAKDKAIVSNCEISGNKSRNNDYTGSAFSSSEVINCKFVNTVGCGSSVEMQNAAVMRGCLFEGNTDVNVTMLSDWNGDVRVEDCQFLNNTLSVNVLGSRGKYNRCLVKGNTTSAHLASFNYSEARISNSLICDNVCTSSSNEPVYLFSGASMINCTVVGNSMKSAKVIGLHNSTMKNSIVAGNLTDANYSGVLSLDGTNTISNNMLEGTFVEGNIDGSMQYAAFTDAENDDYSLSANSYCINGGLDVADSLDLLGKARKQGGAVDMGAIESAHTTAPVITTGDIIYVKSGAKGNGSSWSSAFGDVQQAIFAAAADGKTHQIWVAAGTYYGDTTLSTVVNLASGISLYGGFAGTETSLAARDTAKYPTILDGMGKRRVITQNYDFDSTKAVVVDGFTIQNGLATNGGGLYINANTTINNCIVKENKAISNASAIYATNATIKNTQIFGNTYLDRLNYTVRLANCQMENCVLKNNRTYSSCAMYAESGSIVTNCVFEGNSSQDNSSRGSYINASSLIGCKFVNTVGSGASLYLQGNSIVRECLFEKNQDINTNIIYDWSETVLVEDCRFVNNTTNTVLVSSRGKWNRCILRGNTTYGNVLDFTYAGATISNSLICDNICTSTSTLVNLYNGASMTNCTVARNSTKAKSIVSITNSSLKNSIVVGNKMDANYSGILSQSGTNTISDNMLEATFLEGNIDGSMQYAAFTDPENGDYSLSANSYCINAGADVADTLDLFGNARKQSDAVDLGAIESAHTTAPVITIGEIVYVKAGAQGNGSSWSSPFGDVQQAIFAAAADGKKHQIWVAAGTYYGDTTLSTVVNLASGVSIYGGFAGTETSLSARDTAKNPTILDGMGKRRVITQNYNFDTSMVVVVDGFTIQNGAAAEGAGAYLRKSTVLNNCIVRNCHAVENGTAIYAADASVTNSVICDNGDYASNSNKRGALYLIRSQVDNCIVKDNKGYVVSGLYAESSRITNSLFEGNGTVRECMISLTNGSTMSDCKVLNNICTVSYYCILVRLDGGSVVERCLIDGNETNSNVVYLYSNSSISNSQITNCVSRSASVLSLSGSSEMVNCTVADNQSNDQSIYCYANTQILNSIVVGNKRSNNKETVYVNGATIKHSMIEGGAAGDGNIDGSKSSAAFVNASKGDYSLSERSLCINAGTDVDYTTDMLGNERKQSEAVDMGAIESPFTERVSVGTIIYVKAGATGSGSSWDDALGEINQAVSLASMTGLNHQIWVAKGTYYGDTSLTSAISLAAGVSLYGGFAGGESSLEERDPVKNLTVIDGRYKRRCIIQNYDFADSLAIVVDGFTIQNGGLANNNGVNAKTKKNTTFNNCVFRNAREGDDVVFAEKSVIRNCEFKDNVIQALEVHDGIVDSCAFKDNSSNQNGKRIVYLERSRMSNSEISNHVTNYGVVEAEDRSFITSCKFMNNVTPYRSIVYLGTSTLENSLVCGNVVTGGSNYGVISANSTSFITNATIAHNTTKSVSAIYFSNSYSGRYTTIANSIIYGNKVKDVVCPQVVASDYIKVMYCASDGELTGENNIRLASSNSGSDASQNYVCFINAAGGDYRLHATSSCVDKGLDSVMTAAHDAIGGSRIYGKAIDLGAIEFDGEYVQMLDYSQAVCHNRYSLEASFDSTISKIDWKISNAGGVSGFEVASGSGKTIPAMQLHTSKSTVDTLVVKVTPYDKNGVAGNPFDYKYFVYPDFSKKKVTFSQPQVAYVVNEQNNSMSIEWNRLSLPVEVDSYDLYVWKSTQKMPATPVGSFVKEHYKNMTGLANHTTYKYMVKAVIACDTICSEIDSFRIDIPVSLTLSGNINCVFGSKLNETSSLTRYVKGFELTDSITYEISGRDASDFSAQVEKGWDKLNGGYLRIFYTPTDVKKQQSDAEITIRSGKSDKYKITLYLAGTLSNYYVYDAIVGQNVYHAGDTVDIVGVLTDAYGSPMQGKSLTIEANSNTGFTHSTTDVTDSTGKAAVRFATSPTECGVYTVKVYIGSKSDDAALAKFEIPGMAYTGGTTKWTIQKGDTIDGSITITNRSSVPLHNLVVETRELADGLSVQFDTLETLKGNESARIPYRATGTKLTEDKFYLPSVFRVSSDEETTCDFSTYFFCEQPYGQIKVSPANIDEYVSKQKAKYISLELTNAGFGETGEITLAMPDFSGFSVPSTTLPSLKSGDTSRVSLKVAYYDGAPINVPFTGSIGVNCANGKSTSLPFRIEFSSESKGSLEVDVVDEYFYNTADKKHLSDAQVVVRNQFNNVVVASGYTDSTGIVNFDSIPEGTYLLSVKANKHSEYQETIEIQAGRKLSKFVFLSYQAITYTWNVERVEIEDKYDIDLDFEYETNVPAPVVTLSFPNDVPDVERFEVGVPKTVLLQITNHGLIAAHYVKFGMPSMPYYRFYVPYNYIDSLPANHTEFVPITIVRTSYEYPSAADYSIDNGYGLLLENESLGKSECPSVHAEYSYVCGLLRQKSAVTKPVKGCPYLTPLGGGGNGGGGFDVPIYGGTNRESHQMGNVQNHSHAVNLDLPCNTCLSKVDPWGCAGGLLGLIPVVGPALSWGTEKLHDALEKDAEERRKRLSCEVEEEEEDHAHWFETAESPFNDYELNNATPEDLVERMDRQDGYFFNGYIDYDDEDDEDLPFLSASISSLQTEYKAVRLLVDAYSGELDPYEAVDFIWDQGKEYLDDAKDKIPVVKYVPWECIDMLCQLNSCDAGRYAENCGRYVYDRIMGNNEEDADTRKAVTTAGDTVVIENGVMVDVLYSDGDSLSAQNKPKEPAMRKAQFEMQNSIYQTSDARSLAAQDAVELAGFLSYKTNILRELAGSEDRLSVSGIVDYFDYTIKDYSHGRKISLDSIKKLPTLDLPTTEMLEIAQRWNETVEANENGVYSPNEQYPNIIDKSVISTYMDSIVNFYTYMRLRGHRTLDHMLLSINKQVHKPTQKNICASVKLHISQTLTMTREAFDGTLTVNNGNETGAMEGFKVELEVRDEEGNLANDLFQINTEKVTGASAIDGTGEIAPKSEATAVFRFIPERGAAPTAPVNYSFGGRIIYVDPSSGDTVSADLYPVTLTVNPSPDLQIDYFMQRNILADDALTLDRVEPSVPAALGVRIDNQGYGDAKNVKLETAQPEIVDNEKGLLIDFSIIGSSLNGKDCDLGSENIDFGNIEAHSAKTGVWWMTSSLLGHFTKYEASVVHANSFGNPELSLVKGIAIHELIKTVDAYGVKEDSIVDFLVNDKEDDDDTPDAIYYSNGGMDPVYGTQWTRLDKERVSPVDTVVRLTVTPSNAGWNYAQMMDPGNNCYEIQKVVRVKDSVEIPLDNVWTTFVTLPDGMEPVYVNRLHFLDHMTTLGENDYDIYYSVRKNLLRVTSITGVPTTVEAVTSPVDSVIVTFSHKIQKESFDYRDIELYCQAGDNLSDSTITVAQRDDYTYVVNISSKTMATGFFKIEVNVNNVYDKDGYPGEFGKNATWSQYIEGYGPIVTSVEETETDKIVIYTYGNNIYVKSEMAGVLDIYDLLSRLVVKNARYGEGVTMVATLPKGVYIVNGTKVIVK